MGGKASLARVRGYLTILLFWPALVGFDESSATDQPDPTMPTVERDDPPIFKKALEQLKPRPLPEIPTDPPPHEGAMIQLPYVIEPPDFLLIEVLEALPGRPVSGAHLVRPDGTITLGFYGDLYVKGLTLNQTKAKVVMHMRKFLTDEALGLMEVDFGTPERVPESTNYDSLDMPELPSKSLPSTSRPRSPFELGPQAGDMGRRDMPFEARVVAFAVPLRGMPPLAAKKTDWNGYRPPQTASRTQTLAITRQRQAAERLVQVAQKQATNVDEPSPAASSHFMLEQSSGENTDQTKFVYVDPAKSDRVYVDVDSYNSKNYYIYGDVAQPGRYPNTGHETALDAISFAGGLLSTADPGSMRVVRPGRNGKPAKVYPIDWKAIVEKGDAKANLQLFPGDRLFVDRDPAFKNGEGKKTSAPRVPL